MDERLIEAARVLDVTGLVVRHRGLVFDLERIPQLACWQATRFTATDLGTAVLIARRGESPQEALEACHEVAERVERDGEMPGDDPER